MNTRGRHFIRIGKASTLCVSSSLALFVGASLTLHLSCGGALAASATPAKSSGQAVSAPPAGAAQKTTAAQPSAAAVSPQSPAVAKQPIENTNTGPSTN